MENIDKGLVLLTTIVASILTWKFVFDFYKVRLHKIFSHLIAVVTSSFMFISTMILFVPQNFQRGATKEVEFTILSLLTVVVMVAAIYILFRYLPARGEKKEQAMRKPAKKKK